MELSLYSFAYLVIVAGISISDLGQHEYTVSQWNILRMRKIVINGNKSGYNGVKTTMSSRCVYAKGGYGCAL